MAITKKEVEQVALAARLELTEEEKEIYASQFNSILKYVNKLHNLDTQGVEPTAYVSPLKNVFREDLVQESLKQEEALKNAPSKENGFFKVPKIV